MDHSESPLVERFPDYLDQVMSVQLTSRKRLDELFSEISREGLKAPAAIRSMLAERHGLAAADIDFFVALAAEADVDAVDRDKAVLKTALGYRNAGKDVDLLLEDLDRPFHAAMRILGLGYYVPAHEFVMDCYYEKGAWEPIVRVESGHSYLTPGPFEGLSRKLEEAGRPDLIEKLWTPVVRRIRTEYFGKLRHRDPDQHIYAIEQLKGVTLEAYEHAIDWMIRLGRAEAARRLGEERDGVREGRFAGLPPVSDLRAMDEAVFWELISRARAEAMATEEQVVILGELLLNFKAGDIRKFGSLYARNMRKLYHWNAWALAYAARGGCSDDSFEEFRAWLILQGDPALLELAIREPARAAPRVPADPDLPDGPCTAMIEEAYLQRKGEPLELAMTDLEKPKGKEWPEHEIDTIYPELARHYGRARDDTET